MHITRGRRRRECARRAAEARARRARLVRAVCPARAGGTRTRRVARGASRARLKARMADEESARASVAPGRWSAAPGSGYRASVWEKTGSGGICSSHLPATKYARTNAAAQSQ
eukprot:727486-Pleurochrysis_carterae.AAC.1